MTSVKPNAALEVLAAEIEKKAKPKDVEVNDFRHKLRFELRHVFPDSQRQKYEFMYGDTIIDFSLLLDVLCDLYVEKQIELRTNSIVADLCDFLFLP